MAALELKQLTGYLRLGVRAVVVHPLQLLWRGPRGGGQFRDNYLRERLLPTSPADRAHQREAARCIGCGLCDVPAAAAGLAQLPSLVPRVFARCSVDLPVSREAIAQLAANEPLLEAGERLCPERVPLRGLIHWLTELLVQLDACEGCDSSVAPAPSAVQGHG
jgi:hypothetical protein